MRILEKLNEVEKTDDEIFESDDSDSVVKVSIGVDTYNKEFFFKDKIHFLIYRPQIDPTSSSSTGLRGARKMVSILYSLKNIFLL